MALSRGPAFLYILPLLAVLVLGVSVFFTGGSDEIRSALVLGGPTDTGGPFYGRVQVIRESLGSTFPLEGEEIVVRATQGEHRIERRLTTGVDGWVEFELPVRPKEPFFIEVTDAHGLPLAEGKPELSTARWVASARSRGGEAPLHKKHGMTVRLEVDKRVLAVPFESLARVRVERDGKPLAGAQVEVVGSGITVRGTVPRETKEDGTFSFLVAPEQHTASLDVKVTYGDKSLRFDQLMPVIPGAYGYRQEEDGFRVVSPIPREEAWYTFVRKDARLGGGRIALEDNASGGSEGIIPADSVPPGDGRFLVLASAADGRSPSTVGYPLDGQARTFDAWDAYLIDGAPAARAVVANRQRRVRWTLGGYAGLSGLLTLILFVARIRRADRELSDRLEEVGATKDTSDRSPLPLVIAVLCLFFAFSAGVLWIVAR